MPGVRIASKDDVQRGARLAAAREAAGYRRQVDMAHAAGIIRVEITRLENGTNKFMSETTQRAYADAFGVPLQTMLAYAGGGISLDELKKIWKPKVVAETPEVEDATLRPLRLDEDPLQNRAAAIELLSSTFPPEVLSSLRRMSFKGGDEMEVDDFVERAEQLMKLFKRIKAGEQSEADTTAAEPRTLPTVAELERDAASLPPKKRKRIEPR